MVRPAQVANVLGGRNVLHRIIKSHDDLVALVLAGLPYEALESVAEQSQIGLERLAKTIGVSKSTRARRRSEGVLSPDESDRLYRFARIYAHALDVFDDAEQASSWLLRTDIQAFGKQIRAIAPLELLRTDAGAQQVDDELGRIEHGILS
jgi:putative toxin-antitoxin system antitoxin component (TIGR02293 family)